MLELLIVSIRRLFYLVLFVVTTAIVFFVMLYSETPLVIRFVYFLTVLDIALDYTCFVFLHCVKIKGGLLGCIECIRNKLERKKTNKRPMKILDTRNVMYDLEPCIRRELIIKTMLGPKVSKSNHPLFRVIFGGIPTLNRGGKTSYIRHYISNPITIEHAGSLLMHTAVAIIIWQLIDKINTNVLGLIYIHILGEELAIPVLIIEISIYFLSSIIVMSFWIYHIYPMCLRYMHWTHWLRIFIKGSSIKRRD
ncbi:MAG: hypothetical protein KZQ73_00025 [Candidatus Thiodiazotropha sp. (ex Semelilucina semeliformis)]|nr:hypothetical protein [Candidatus Thiodiazotropha sp. (ex Semelilucina semeliformis)]